NHMIPNATLYHFGILTSKVHMDWMRTVAGRLEMRYRYSSDVVYNNFPWPSPSEGQKKKIEETAQSILNARALYANSSLADLYDENTMPPELRKAHQANDKAVIEAYGFPPDMTEAEIVAKLMKMYQALVEAQRNQTP
ncbi:MAG: methylase, partial [Verrucomicrobia bacterium]|nr:methylase [Verrucomicrobiota bacterium]